MDKVDKVDAGPRGWRPHGPHGPHIHINSHPEITTSSLYKNVEKVLKLQGVAFKKYGREDASISLHVTILE